MKLTVSLIMDIKTAESTQHLELDLMKLTVYLIMDIKTAESTQHLE